ncbi:MAG: P-loop NTPase, partial [Anaerolineae bacterium]
MDLTDVQGILRKWWWLLVASTAVAAIGSFITVRLMPDTYMSQTTLMVGRATSQAEPIFNGLYLSQQLAGTYAQMATRQPVLERVMNDLELEGHWTQLKGMVSATQVPGTQLIEIKVVDTISERAQVIAQAVAESLVAEGPKSEALSLTGDPGFVTGQVAILEDNIRKAQQEMSNIDRQIALETSARGIADLQTQKQALADQLRAWRTQHSNYLAAVGAGGANAPTIIEKATPALRVGPNVGRNVLLAAALGLGLALGAIMLVEFLDDTVKTVEQVERRLGLPGLATIERVVGAEHRRDVLETVLHPRSPVAEAFRMLRTNLEFSLLAEDTRAVLITSANPGEGKSTTAANLAVALAQGGASVLLLDSDLRRPSLHRFFELPNDVGLTSMLLDRGLAIDKAVQPVAAVSGLDVLTSGPLPPNPAEVLQSSLARDLLAHLAG